MLWKATHGSGKTFFVAGSFSSTNCCCCCFVFWQHFFHTVSKTVFCNFFKDETDLGLPFERCTQEPFCFKTCCVIHFEGQLWCHATKCERLNSQVSHSSLLSFSWENFSRIKLNLCSKAVCHPHLFSDCSDDDWSVPWFWSGTLNHKTLQKMVGDFAV